MQNKFGILNKSIVYLCYRKGMFIDLIIRKRSSKGERHDVQLKTRLSKEVNHSFN